MGLVTMCRGDSESRHDGDGGGDVYHRTRECASEGAPKPTMISLNS